MNCIYVVTEYIIEKSGEDYENIVKAFVNPSDAYSFVHQEYQLNDRELFIHRVELVK